MTSAAQRALAAAAKAARGRGVEPGRYVSDYQQGRLDAESDVRSIDPAQFAEETKRPLVYLASPYSHPERAVRVERFDAACRAAARLMGNGVHLYAPIPHTHPIAEAGDLPKGWDFWGAYDRAILSCCHKVIVLTLDGWQESKGVQAEIAIAAEQGIAVEYMDPVSAPATAPSAPSGTETPSLVDIHIGYCKDCMPLAGGKRYVLCRIGRELQEADSRVEAALQRAALAEAALRELRDAIKSAALSGRIEDFSDLIIKGGRVEFPRLAKALSNADAALPPAPAKETKR